MFCVSRYAAILFAAACAGGAAHAATPVALTNPGMEEPYYAVNLNGGAISGYLANGWTENSAWANTTVQYSERTPTRIADRRAESGRDQRRHRPRAVHSTV